MGMGSRQKNIGSIKETITAGDRLSPVMLTGVRLPATEAVLLRS
jgi:hypothetical protein